MSLLPLALQLSFVNAAHLVDRRDLVDRLVVAKMGDAREAKRVAGLVACRLLNAVEGNLQDDHWFDGVHGSVLAGGRRLEVFRQMLDLRIGESGVSLADVDEIVVAANSEGEIRENRAPLAVTVFRGGH